jgi:hypothetical protein
LKTKRGKSSWKKKKNGGLKVGPYGSRQEMKTQSFFIDMPTVGGTLIQYGKLKRMMAHGH